MLSHLPGSRIRVRVCGVTDPGMKRVENQDCFLIADLSEPELDLRRPSPEEEGRPRIREMEVGPRGALFMVADGMGGAAGGRVASRMATSHVLTSIAARWTQERGPSPDRFVACLEEAIQSSNALIHEQSTRHPAYHGMGTTATVAGVFEDYVYLAQVGDSRAYLVRGGRCTQLTLDQSFENFAVERGLMSQDEVAQSAHRNVILQALGPKASVEADLTFQHLRLDDVLVLCSDGLFRVVDEPEIAAAASVDVADACDALVKTARERGAPDNVTVLLARFGGEGLRPPAGNDPVGRQPLRERSG